MFLEAAPAELAALDREQADARDAATAAEERYTRAETHLAEVDARAKGGTERVEAEHDLDRARELAAEATARVQRIASEREALAAAAAGARDETRALESEAQRVHEEV